MRPYLSFFIISIPSYGLCMTIAIFLCAFFSIRTAMRHGLLLENMIIFSVLSVGAGLLCGGLLYLLVSYTPTQIFHLIMQKDFSFITNSGLVFYGSLLGGITCAIFVAKILCLDIVLLEKSIIPYIPLGHAIGRIGCLLAGCCYGFEYTGFLAVSSSFVPQKTFFPLPAIESIGNILIMFFLLWYVKKPRIQYGLLSIYLFLYSLLRFCLEFFRGDTIRGHFLILSTSQWISLFLLFVCFLFHLYEKNKSCFKS